MLKKYFLFIGLLLFVGCASSGKVFYDVTSNPQKAPIDVNGVSMGETPTTISLECTKKWVGIMNSPDGWMRSGHYSITAYPPRNFQGQSQTKQVDPCQWEGPGNAALYFDLGLESVAPKQKIEITTKSINSESNAESKTEKAINALKTLRDQGIISEDEYKAKVLELVN